MEQTVGRRIVNRFGCYFALIVLVAGLYGIEVYRTSGPSIYKYVPIQDKLVDAFMQMNRLLTTLATTLLGAIGFLLFDGLKGRHFVRELWAAIAGTVFIGVSIYYGYAAYVSVMSMLSTGSFDIYSPDLRTVEKAHFYTFLLGVALLAVFVYQNIWTKGGHED